MALDGLGEVHGRVVIHVMQSINSRIGAAIADRAALDRAVWVTYGWDDDPAETTDEEILERVLALNEERAAESNQSADSGSA